ncbi:unnamed protein product [Merluccius merluccius]
MNGNDAAALASDIDIDLKFETDHNLTLCCSLLIASHDVALQHGGWLPSRQTLTRRNEGALGIVAKQPCGRSSRDSE